MKLRENPAMKALAFIAAVAAFAATAIMGWYQLANYDALWGMGYDAGDGYTIYYLEREDEYSIQRLLDMRAMEEAGIELSLYQEQELAQLEERLDAQRTNLRWQLRDQDRAVQAGNTAGSLPTQAPGLYFGEYVPWIWDVSTQLLDETWEQAAQYAVNVDDADNVACLRDWYAQLELYLARYQADMAGGTDGGADREETGPAVSAAPEEGWSRDGVDLDTVFLSDDGTGDLLLVESGDGAHLYGPCLRWMLEPNEFGFRYSGGWVQAEEGQAQDLVLWLDGAFPVEDAYRRAYFTLERWKQDRELLLGATAACGLAGVLLTAYLCAAAGHRRGREGITLNWFHRIPGDLLLFLLACGMAVTTALGARLVVNFYAYTDLPMTVQLVLVGLLTAGAAAMGLGGVLTVAVRCKARTLWRNTLVWRLCRAAAQAVPLGWKAAAGGAAYVLFTILFFQSHGGLWLLGSGVCVALLCLWAAQWRRVRQGTREIIGGNPDRHIDTRGMFPDLRRHADELNSLGASISAAVEERMRSEHFKAELITNVSHDLKTPLTSIINYVDLLKKEEIGNPRAAEYIEVLDRKSQRLKKLTEDLVEASKASTGSLTVNLERLDLGQLLEQAAAEYLDRLEGRGLSLVPTLPGQPVWVMADGRHLWRVMDNLLGNCAKYALEGTRIYLDVQGYSDTASFSLKNISREELNIPPERLLERFVRGDESRTAEGSGLGLSIAQSLTELQHGRLEIAIDGDLFKATVTLPKADPPEGEEGAAGAL